VKKAVILVCAILGGGLILAGLDQFIAPMFLNSRIERLNEIGLPKVSVEKGGKIYCRMKADDFRFSLPPGSHAESAIITAGGFDYADGTVEARFESSNQVTPSEYEDWLSSRMQLGGYVTASAVPGGLTIKFHYFGDK